MVAWGVTSLLTWLFTRHLFKAHKERQEKIADLLDTSTPGGLRDVVRAMSNTFAADEGEEEMDDDNDVPEDIQQQHHTSFRPLTGHGK